MYIVYNVGYHRLIQLNPHALFLLLRFTLYAQNTYTTIESVKLQNLLKTKNKYYIILINNK